MNYSIDKITKPLLDLSIEAGWFIWESQGTETDDHSLYLKVLLYVINIVNDEFEHVVQLSMILEGSDGCALVVPEIHHDTLDQHVLVVVGLCIHQLTDVEVVNLMDAVRNTFSEVLKHCHQEGDCAHWVHLIC